MLENKSRTRNTIINSLIGMSSYIVIMIVTMMTRVYFARYLGKELLGLNSLYASVLQLLQISELGIGNAIIISLYEPVKNHNKEKIKSLIGLYKKVYSKFVIILFLLGVLVLQFILPIIVNVKYITMREAKIYFLLFLLGIISSYLLAYTKSIFYAEEKNGFIFTVNAVQKVIVSIFQILAIVLWENYYAFLVLIIVGNFVENIISTISVYKKHSYLKDSHYTELGRDEKNSIIALIKPIFVVKIADKIINQSDSIIINQFINIVTLGMYGNYHTIFNSILGLFSPIGASLTSSYGNMAVCADKEEKYNAYKKSYNMLHFVVVLFCAYFFAFIQDFISFTYGKDFLLSNRLSFFMTVYLYLELTKTIYYSYQNAMGLHRLDQKYIIMQIPFNIIVSIIFVFLLGIEGVILGTILSLMLFSLNFKGKLLYQYSFGKSRMSYYKKTLVDIVKFFSVVIFVFIIKDIIIPESIVGFVLKTLVMAIIVCLFVLLISLLDKDFKYDLINLMKRV